MEIAMPLPTNVGYVDRFFRLAIGLVLISLSITGAIGVWGYIGIVPLVTGLVRFCPLYKLVGLNTCPRAHR
jgi:hypothetical protein